MAYQKSTKTEEILNQLEKDVEKIDFGKIRCPLCNWSPKASSRWCCADCEVPENFFGGCFTNWNTFETQGKCPICSHQWLWTSCLSCHQWSLHKDWYN